MLKKVVVLILVGFCGIKIINASTEVILPDAHIYNLVIENANLDKTFDPNETFYTITLDNENVDMVFFSYTVLDKLTGNSSGDIGSVGKAYVCNIKESNKCIIVHTSSNPDGIASAQVTYTFEVKQVSVEPTGVNSMHIGEYKTDEMIVKFLNENEMELLSGDENAVIEDTKGTYIIEDNKLIYKRLYKANHTDKGLIWESCDGFAGECGDVKSLEEEFIIIDQETLKIENYMEAAGRNPKTLILTYQEESKNSTNLNNQEKDSNLPENPKTGSFISLLYIVIAGFLSGTIYYIIKIKNKIYKI